ncbi:hypothetical protein ACH50O_20660 [Methylomonas sp. 2BW1-5-20]|uniref:hypothetical protein n=1 Tax=Methylomonas sp. 2BW1-5-20 TaxID=3376686 RepID=UPI00404F81F6
MTISNIGPSLAAYQTASGKYPPRSPDIKPAATVSEQSAGRKNVDMHNVSLNEINSLIKSGVDGLLDIVPCIPVAINNQSQADDIGNVKVDYLGQIEGMIEFQKGRNQDTAFLEKVLSNVKRIDGMALPALVDVKV